ncbi:MAG: formyltransferase family protein [Patescibacteria group bacterium]
MEQKVRTILIASGSGTDALAIMQAYKDGFIPNINLVALISTKKDAGCLEKASLLGIPGILLDPKLISNKEDFNKFLVEHLRRLNCQLVFLVGCIVKVLPVEGISIYNIHPAGLTHFGGKGMYGLKVHERVLLHVADQISREKKAFSDRFFTYPTVHEVVLEYDSGEPLLQVSVEIPFEIIFRLIVEKAIDLKTAAEELQKHVLPYEWAMLPTAVNIAAKKILTY